MPQHHSVVEAGRVWSHLRGARQFRADATCCSFDKVESVLHYARVVLDFKESTLQEQQDFAAVVSRSLARADTGNPCQELVAAALQRRILALRAALEILRTGFKLLRLLLRNTLRTHCLLPRGVWAAARAKRAAGRGAIQLAQHVAELASAAAVVNQEDLEAWEESAKKDLHHCFPAPFRVALQGTALPKSSWLHHVHDIEYPFSRARADVRTWLVWVDRFSLVLSRFPAKLAYQLKVFTASFDPVYRQGPLGLLFWQRDLLAASEAKWRWPIYGGARRRRVPARREWALVVLVSNRTRQEEVEALWSEVLIVLDASDAVEALWLEDSLRQPWATSVRPEHAGGLTHRRLAWEQARPGEIRGGLFVLWRRHQASLSSVEVALLHLGPSERCAGVLVCDARHAEESHQRGSLHCGLVAALRRRATHKISASDLPAGLTYVADAAVRETVSRVAARSPATWALTKMDTYLSFHRQTVEAWQKGTPSSGRLRALVYVCNPFCLCGGHGDRTNGILSTFVLAVLTNRAFFIDSDSPLPLGLLLQPRRSPSGDGFVLDWRLRGGAVGLSSHVFYLDDRMAFQEDLSWLIRDPSPVLLVSMNHRELQALLSHPLLAARARELQLAAWPHLAAQLWNLLFEPTPLLRDRLQAAQEELGLRGPWPWSEEPTEEGGAGEAARDAGFLAIHFRAGNESARLWWDPGRHALSSLPRFFECAAQAERELGLPNTTQWFLSADTQVVLGSEAVLHARRAGKLVFLGEGWRLAHVDRSHVNLGLQGFADSYVAYMLIASARAVVLSRSYFGETAAEIGAVPSTYFAEGCVPTDLHSS